MKLSLTEKWPRPRKLERQDLVAGFRCGTSELDTWLESYAYINQQNHMATVLVSVIDDEVCGYIALASGEVTHENTPARILKGVARHPIPVVVLGRLAVNIKHQGKGLGSALLGEALRRTALAANEIGVRALVVHCKDDAAEQFYLRRAEFEESPTDPMHRFLLTKDVIKTISSSLESYYALNNQYPDDTTSLTGATPR